MEDINICLQTESLSTIECTLCLILQLLLQQMREREEWMETAKEMLDFCKTLNKDESKMDQTSHVSFHLVVNWAS